MGVNTLPRLGGGDWGDGRDWRAWGEQVRVAERLPGWGMLHVVRPVGSAGITAAAAAPDNAPEGLRDLTTPHFVEPPLLGRLAVDDISLN